MDKNKVKGKYGFTLIELVVVMLLIGIISSAVFVVFRHSNLSFMLSQQNAFFQEDARQALREVEPYLGVSSSVDLYNTRPEDPPYEEDYSYCYFENGILIFYNATTKRISQYFSENSEGINVEFYPLAPTGLVDKALIRIVISLNNFSISSDVAIQNIDSTLDRVNDKRINPQDSAKYIEFTQP